MRKVRKVILTMTLQQQGIQPAEVSILEGDENDLLTVREVAKGLRVDDTTVRRWIKDGVLEAVVLPHRGTRQGYRIWRRAVRDALTKVHEAKVRG